MRSSFRSFAVVLLAVALAGPVFISGCAEHTRYYGPYYSDYHTWNSGEVVYYNRWEHDTHRDHVDFAKRMWTGRSTTLGGIISIRG
jgi:hypothetical protein